MPVILSRVDGEGSQDCRLLYFEILRRASPAQDDGKDVQSNQEWRRTMAKSTKSDPSVSYNEFKEYEGRKYTGMKVGRSHKWYYDKGEWKEKKITPDLWEINYAVTKRRAGKAPEGSGVPVDTEYHWYIVAHQNVRKLNANDYTTSMAGLKFKVAYKKAETGKWSASPRAQRNRLIKFLRDVIDDLEKQQDEQVEETVAALPAAKTRVIRRPRRLDSKKRRIA
jgi:hypothetical protein